MGRIKWLATACVLASHGAWAADDELARKFGAREQVEQVSLSPNGLRFAAVMATKGRGSRVIVGDLGSDKPVKTLLQSGGAPERLDRCNWATDTRLVCSVFLINGKGRDAVPFTRMLTLSAEGGDTKLLSARATGNALGIMQSGGQVIDWLGGDDAGALLMTRQFVPEETTGTHLAQTGEGLGVERVDPATLRRSLVEMPNTLAREYITDGHGTVRVAGFRRQDYGGYDQRQIDYRYRKPGAHGWEPLSRVTGDAQSSTGFDPYAVDRDLNVAYGFDVSNGRSALFKVALDGSLKRELVYARPDVDIDGLVRIGRQHRVVGVSFVTDKRQTDFFDPALKKLSASLSKAIPGLPLVSFVDASGDENKLLLFAGSDVDPGRYMVFDKKTRHLDALLDARPDLDGVKLSPVRAISYPAADGTPIPAYLTLPVGGTGKELPAIVMPHGGPGARDEWGFDWLAQFFAAKGYAVIQPNFRGSTGYGEAWFQKNGFQSWRVAIGDVDDAGRWLLKQGVAAPGKLAIVGWSYGGYAALQSAVLDPDLFKAIVAVAPVTDLNTLREEHRNITDFNLVDAFIGKGPHVREGSPAQNVARIKAPVLLFHGDQDINVGVGESRLMAAKLKGAGGQVEYVEFKGLDHQLDDDDARTQLLSRSDAFLRKALGM